MLETATLAHRRDLGWRFGFDAPRRCSRCERSSSGSLLAGLADVDVRTLSGGERQRVALATALLQEAPILLLDEPASHLDPAHQRLLLRLLRDHADAGGAVVASLHDLNLAWDLASHAVLIDGRGGAFAGTREQVFDAGRLGAVFGVTIEAVEVARRDPLPDRGRTAPRSARGRAADESRRRASRVGAAGSCCLATIASRPARASAWALSAVDDSGHEHVFEAPPKRVVTLAPSLTELVFAAGAGASLVGTTALSDYPEAARRIARIGDAGRLDVERVLTMKPDLVLVWQRGATSREQEQLAAAGIRSSTSSRVDSTTWHARSNGSAAARHRRSAAGAPASCAANWRPARSARRRGAGARLLSGLDAAADDDQSAARSSTT